MSTADQEPFDLEHYVPPPEPPHRGRSRRPRGLLRQCVIFTSGVCFAIILDWCLGSSFFGLRRGPIDGRVVNDVAAIIAENFVDPRDHQQLMVNALRGMTRDLDQYSGYISPQEYPGFLETTEGEYVGIGVLLEPSRPDADRLRIEGVLPGGPAHSAGLRPGDIIAGVERITPAAGHPTRQENLPLRQQLRGPAGSTVTLRVLPATDSGGEERAVGVVRARVTVPSIAMTGVIGGERPIGYLRITQFQSNTPAEFVRAMGLLDNKEIEGLVLDLRVNPGGVFRSAVDIATELLPEGTPIVTTHGNARDSSKNVYRASRQGRWTEIPLVVLIDGGTASASEILSAAIHDHRRGVLIGERTYGKGRVQTIYSIRKNPARYGLLKLTTQKFYSPSGRSIDHGDRGDETATARDHTAHDEPHDEPHDGSTLEATGERLALDDGATSSETLDAAATHSPEPGTAGGVSPDLHVDLDDFEPFVTALQTHFRDRPLDLWRRGEPATEATDYQPFEWTDPETGVVYRDRQLEEAISCLENPDLLDRLLAREQGATEQ